MAKKIAIYLIDYYSAAFAFLTIVFTLFLTCFFSIKLTEAFLLSCLLWNIGIRGILSFIANWLPIFSQEIAKSYDWPLFQPFQKEVAAADGAFGLMGILSLFFGEEFWIATIIGFVFCTFFSEIAGIVDVFQEERKTTLPFNRFLKFGMQLDLVLSIILVLCLILWGRGY